MRDIYFVFQWHACQRRTFVVSLYELSNFGCRDNSRFYTSYCLIDQLFSKLVIVMGKRNAKNMKGFMQSSQKQFVFVFAACFAINQINWVKLHVSKGGSNVSRFISKLASYCLSSSWFREGLMSNINMEIWISNTNINISLWYYHIMTCW